MLEADGAVAVWPLNDNTATKDVIDIIGGRNLTSVISNTDILAAPPLGPESTGSLEFNGRGDSGEGGTEENLTYTDATFFDVGLGDFSWECWFNVPSVVSPQTYTLIFCGELVVGFAYSTLIVVGSTASSPVVQVQCTDGLTTVTSTVDITLNQPHHLVWTRRAGDMFLIVDGVESLTGSFSIDINTFNNVMQVAAVTVAPSVDYYGLDGFISYVAFYKNGLSATQSANHFNNSTPLFLSEGVASTEVEATATELTLWGPERAPKRHIEWAPIDYLEFEFGVLQIIVDGVDVTYFRDVATQVGSWSYDEPFDDRTLSVAFPQITPFEEPGEGDLSWLRDWAFVEMIKRGPGDYTSIMFQGNLADFDDVLDQGQCKLAIQVQGSFRMLTHYTKHPVFYTEPIDISALLMKVINDKVQNYQLPLGLAIFPYTRSIFVRESGAWQSLLSYIEELIALAQAPEDALPYTLMLSIGRRPELVRKDMTTVHWRATCGTPGITHNLSRDLTMAPTTMYGEGVDPSGCRWRNTKYPSLRVDDAPVFQGTVFTVGTSVPDVQIWKDEMRKNGWYVTDGGTYNSADAQTCRDFQLSAGIQVDGVVGPQTWAATFEVGSGSGDPTDVYFAPIYTHSNVEPYLYASNGAITGPNPNFDKSVQRVERYTNFGTGVTKFEASKSAALEIDRAHPASWLGTITLVIDPENGSRLLMRAGQNILYKHHRGTNRLLHIVSAEIDFANLVTMLTVDEQARDANTVAALKSRDRDTFGPSRRKSSRRNSEIIQDTRAAWDCLPGYSLVYTEFGPKAIKDICVGDRVWSWAEGALRLNTVERSESRGFKQVFEIKTGRRSIRATAGHKFIKASKQTKPRDFGPEQLCGFEDCSVAGTEVGLKRHRAKKHGIDWRISLQSSGRDCRSERTLWNEDMLWTELSDLKVGDRLVQLDSLEENGSVQYVAGREFDMDLAWLVGLCMGDGTLRKSRNIGICVYGELREKAIDVAAFLFEATVCVRSYSEGVLFNVSHEFSNIMEALGVVGIKSINRQIPEIVWLSPRKVQEAFIAGYENADVHIVSDRYKDRKQVGFAKYATGSKYLADQMRALHIMLGNPVSNIFVERRPDDLEIKGTRVKTCEPLHRFTVMHGCADNDLRRSDKASNFAQQTIRAIEPCGVEETFDIQVARDHNFIAEGVVVHNCENGAGIIPRHAIYKGLWNVLRIPCGSEGSIVRAEFRLDTPARFSVGVFDRQTTHSEIVGRIGQSPITPTASGDNPWDLFPDQTGLMIAWGGSDTNGAGYFPLRGPDNPLTGIEVDNASWYFKSSLPPWLWVALWCETTNYIEGRFYPSNETV